MKRSRLVASAPVTDESERVTNSEILVNNRAEQLPGTVGHNKVHSKTRHYHHHHTRPLTNRLSKSHDNLASVLRRKAAVVMLAGNKENMERDMGASMLSAPCPKTAKITDALMRKSQSTRDIDHCDEPLQRAQSVHNICMVPGSQFTTGTTYINKQENNSVVPRRSASTRNIDQKGSPQLRISVPPNMMAYNAELLASFEKEKKVMERRISELIQVAENRKTEIEKLKFAVKNLTEAAPPSDGHQQLEQLLEENHLLKNKLMEDGVSVEHFTDSEKLSLLQKVDGGCMALEPMDRKEAPAAGGDDFGSTGMPKVDAEAGSEQNPTDQGMSLSDLYSLTAEHPSPGSADNMNWEHLSTKSSEATSEVAVASLQDRIQQMEETHYSTNEELQATLQELTDLQQTVNSLTEENEQLSNEKSVLLASLCAQTEKLENCRMQIEHMKAILMTDVAVADRSENERLLVELIRSAEVEKEEFLLRQMGLTHTMQLVESENRESQDIIAALRDKVHILDMKNESLHADKKTADAALATLREQVATDQIEMQRYKTLLENERQKVAELEQFRNTTDRTEVEELLDHSRQDKEKLEERLTNLQEELSKGRNEVARQRETLASLEEELKVCKNNAKTKVSDLEYSFTQMKTEKQEMQQEVDTLRDHIDQLQVDCDRFLEEKATDTANVTQLEAKLDTAQARVYELDGEMAELRQKYWSEQEEWRQFQSDLQMAVVIANEIKVETEEDVEKLNHDNKTLKERCTLLEDQNHRVQEELHRLQMKTESKLAGPGRSDLRDRMLSSFDHDLAMLTCGHTLSGPEAKATSVKNLIATIEKQVKSDMGTPPESPAHTGSRRNSADSNVSLGSFKSDASPKGLPIRHGSLTSATALHKVDSKDSRAFSHRHTLANIIYESAPVTDDTKAVSPSSSSGDSVKMSRASSIRSAKSVLRRSGEVEPKPDKAATSQVLRSDPLGNLAKQMGGSKRNALLKWCQARTASYTGIDITNFSSSWNDGLAFCALLHTYLKDKIPYKRLSSQNKLENFTVVFKAAESVGIPSILNISDMVSMERPDWQAVMSYVTSIYKHFEVDKA